MGTQDGTRTAPCHGVRMPYVLTSRSVTRPHSKAETTSGSSSRPVSAAADIERFSADIGVPASELSAPPLTTGGVWPAAAAAAVDRAAAGSGDTPFLGFKRGFRTPASSGVVSPGVSALPSADVAPHAPDPLAITAAAAADAALVVGARGLHVVGAAGVGCTGGGAAAHTSRSSAEVLWKSRTRGDEGLEPALEGAVDEGAPCPPREWRELAADPVLVASPDPTDVRRLWIKSCTEADKSYIGLALRGIVCKILYPQGFFFSGNVPLIPVKQSSLYPSLPALIIHSHI